jgi:hypothetical protein
MTRGIFSEVDIKLTTFLNLLPGLGMIRSSVAFHPHTLLWCKQKNLALPHHPKSNYRGNIRFLCIDIPQQILLQDYVCFGRDPSVMCRFFVLRS